MRVVGLVSILFKMRYNMYMKFVKKNLEKIILITYVILLPVISFAADGDGTATSTAGKILNPLKDTNSIPDLIRILLVGALKIGIPVIALAVIYCGFLFVKAQGKPEELTKAKGALTWTLVGGGVLLGAWAIANMIADTIKLF